MATEGTSLANVQLLECIIDEVIKYVQMITFILQTYYYSVWIGTIAQKNLSHFNGILVSTHVQRCCSC